MRHTGGIPTHQKRRKLNRGQQQTFTWERIQALTTELEELLLEQLENGLDPIELEPLYFQVTGGLVIRF